MPPSSPVSPVSEHLGRDWRLFQTAVFFFSFGFAMYGSVFINDITEVLGVKPLGMGVLESTREIPGLLAVGIAALAASHAESRIGALCLCFSAIGVAATGFVHNFTELVAVTVFWSVFMHQWFTTSSVIPLALSGGQEGGRHLGRMGTIGAAGTILAFLIVLPLAHHVPYPIFFVAAGALILIGGLALLPMSTASATFNRPRLLFRREYGLFYGLTFLEGCRRQIFSTFALFALVEHWRVPLRQIATLMLLNAVASLLVATPIGRMIDKHGERRMMTFYYAAIGLTFAGYALSQNVLMLKSLWVVDSILFSFGVGITTYLHRIIRPGELTSSLSMGQTMNHIAAVAVPITGGLLWHAFGYHAPFWAGVGAALLSLILTQAVAARPELVAVEAAS